MLRHAWTLFLCLLMVGGAAATYQIKYRAEAASDKARELRAEIDTLEEEISRLKAHWSLYNQPSRLQALVENNAEILPLEPMAAHQSAKITSLPERSALSKMLPQRKPSAIMQEGDIAALIEGAQASDRNALEDIIQSEVN